MDRKQPGPQPGPQQGPEEGQTDPTPLYAPWRMAYIESLADEPPKPAGSKSASTGVFLADYWQSPELDEANHVIVRTEHGMILLNGYPYANGHLLVALGDGRPRLLDYSAQQRAALWELVDLAMALMERAIEPQGVNVGINQGRAAGAGVPTHLHVHLVPRWGGDVNFMAAVGRVRVIPSSLDAMASRYREAWSVLGPGPDAGLDAGAGGAEPAG